MASTGMLTPASVPLVGIVGADFSTTINLYTDAAQTTAFDLTGYSATLVIGTFTLTIGSGLTVATPANGTIVAALTAVQTLTIPPAGPNPAAHWSLKLTDAGGVVSYPLNGTATFTLP